MLNPSSTKGAFLYKAPPMADDTPQTKPSSSNAMAAIEKAKEVATRYKRQVGYLLMLQGRLPILESALVYSTKVAKEETENAERLTKEVAVIKDHINKLTTWVAKNADTPDDVATANVLAEKIKRLQREIERKQREMHRLEAGLPEVEA